MANASKINYLIVSPIPLILRVEEILMDFFFWSVVRNTQEKTTHAQEENKTPPRNHHFR